MCELPFPWCVYKEIQSKASCCDRITSWSWGIENGLNNFLAAVQSGSVTDSRECEEGIDRAIATGSRVERNRARLRREYLREDREVHAEPRMLAGLRLAEIQSAVSRAEWELLLAVAAGIPCRDIAGRLGITAGAVRTRLSRLRGRLAVERGVNGAAARGRGPDRLRPAA